jgi:DNA-binding transcriptional ArsR family regulator
MMLGRARSVDELGAKAAEAAVLLRALSNEHRLLILCHLIADGELAVGDLVERVGLSPSALSQHLARLREEGLVCFRRESQTLLYQVADPKAALVLECLWEIYCAEAKPRRRRALQVKRARG